MTPNSFSVNSFPLHITQREPNEIPNEYIFDTIVNDGTLEELKIKVEKVWKKIKFIEK
jgi:hypothetical protein